MQMRKKTIWVATMLVLVLALTGCTSGDKQAATSQPIAAKTALTYQTIDAATAYKMMGESKNYILLDVRTQEEYDEAHIEGALLLPDTEIAAKAPDVLPNPNAAILVYCRSGRRSANSAALLASMGYTQVYDFGGIIDWPYETVSGSK
jgi:rhodanese-related sulfurtransferase